MYNRIYVLISYFNMWEELRIKVRPLRYVGVMKYRVIVDALDGVFMLQCPISWFLLMELNKSTSMFYVKKSCVKVVMYSVEILATTK